MDKKQHGGARPGSGRKKREETTTTGFCINSEALAVCKKHYGRGLNNMVNEFIKEKALALTPQTALPVQITPPVR